MMKKKREFTWKAFWIRQVKTYIPLVFVVFVLWHGVEYGRLVHEFFNWPFEGYGPPQQRWYRVIASGFIIMCMFGSFIDAISVWHYIKNPHEIPKDNEDIPK